MENEVTVQFSNAFFNPLSPNINMFILLHCMFGDHSFILVTFLFDQVGIL